MSSGDRLARLQDIPLFAGLDRAALERLVEASTEIDVAAGHVLIRADDPGSGMFVLEEGTVVVESPRVTLELGPGEFFGELSLLVPDAKRAARVRAATPVRCVALDRATLEAMLDEEPGFALDMLRVVAQRLAKVTRG